jgi:hypothetical protein
VTTFTLEPNNAAWGNADAVENVHHYTLQVHATHVAETAYNPMGFATSARSLGAFGGAIRGGNLANPAGNFSMDFISSSGNTASMYSYHGGTQLPPGGQFLEGLMNYGWAMHYAPDPPGSPAINIGCPYSGCTDAAFTYNFFNLTGNGGNGSLSWTPNTRTFAWTAALMDFLNAPITRPTIKSNANGSAATLAFNSVDSGAVSHQWTVSAPSTGGGYTLTLPQETGTLATLADIPAALTNFGGSGAGHKAGLVPDPGSSAGTTHFLREDATWATTSGMLTNVPPGLQFLGDGSEGAYSCPSGSCNIIVGEHWYSSFNVSSGATLTTNGNPSQAPVIIRSTGACTVAGNFNVDARNSTANWGGGGGGGGGGTVAGTAGSVVFGNNNGLGSAGASSGGTGGTPTLFPMTAVKHFKYTGGETAGAPKM